MVNLLRLRAREMIERQFDCTYDIREAHDAMLEAADMLESDLRGSAAKAPGRVAIAGDSGLV